MLFQLVINSQSKINNPNFDTVKVNKVNDGNFRSKRDSRFHSMFKNVLLNRRDVSS